MNFLYDLDKSRKFAVTFYSMDKIGGAIFPFFKTQFSLSVSNIDIVNIIIMLNSTLFTGSETEGFLPLGSAFVIGS